MASREGPRTGYPRNLTFQEGFLEEDLQGDRSRGFQQAELSGQHSTGCQGQTRRGGGSCSSWAWGLWKPYMRKHDYGHMATKLLRENSFPCGLQVP